MSTLSPWKSITSRTNAQLSTGPKTDAGKAKSSRNALKHGLTAKTLPIGEDHEAVEEARERWIGTLNPQNDISLALAQASFDCKMRYDFVTRAEDAAVAIRVVNARDKFKRDRNTYSQDLRKQWHDDPATHYDEFCQTTRGAGLFRDMAEGLKAAFGRGVWNPLENMILLMLEGRARDAIDAQLESALTVFDAHRKATTAIQSARNAGEGKSDVVEGAKLDIDEMQKSLTFHKCEIERRIDERIQEFTELHAQNMIDYQERMRLVMEAARFDNTKSGQNRHRYLRDAWRDYAKATEYACAAAGPEPDPAPALTVAPVEIVENLVTAAPEPAERKAASKADSHRKAPPNEAKSPCSDCADLDAMTPIEASTEALEDHPERR